MNGQQFVLRQLRAASYPGAALVLAYPEGAETARAVLNDLQAPALAAAAALVATLELAPPARKDASNEG